MDATQDLIGKSFKHKRTGSYVFIRRVKVDEGRVIVQYKDSGRRRDISIADLDKNFWVCKYSYGEAS